MKSEEVKKNKSYCFDVTVLLGEKPKELWLGYLNGQLILGAASKTEERMKRCVGGMWEVENGIHKRESISMLTLGISESEKILDYLLLLFGDNDTDISEIKIQKHKFSSTKKFWEFVNTNDLAHVIVDSRLTPKMEQMLKEERLKYGEAGNLH